MSYITGIDLRRVWIADEEKGEDSQDRGNGVHAPVILKERLEPVPSVAVSIEY
jgi:hypothetical protein